MKVLLIEPGYNWPYPDRPWSPWGKMQLAAYIRPHGFDPYIMDNAFWDGTDDGIRQTIGTEIQPDIIGLGGMTLQLHDTLRIARVIHEMYPDPDKRPLLVAGGVHFTFCPEDAHELFDIIVIGEGEATFLEICQQYKETHEKRGQKNIAGVQYCTSSDDNVWTFTKNRPFLTTDQIPIPAFDLLPWFAEYNDGFITGEKVPMLIASRGCPFDCAFCAAPQLYKRKPRIQSMDWVIECVRQLRKVHPGKGLRIMDDTFALSNKRVLNFCDRMTSEFGKVSMTCLTHCDTVTKDTMHAMVDAGFWATAVGVESGNNEVLKLINKGITIEQAGAAVELARSTGMMVECLFMMANMGETEQTCIDTIEFAKKYNPPTYDINATCNWFQFATPFPGSRFYDEAEKYGTIVTKDYNRYHHQEPVFIPNGMTSDQLMRLRARAFAEAQ